MGLADLAEQGVLTKDYFKKLSGADAIASTEWDMPADEARKASTNETFLRNKALRPDAVHEIFGGKAEGESFSFRSGGDFSTMPFEDITNKEPYLGYDARQEGIEEVVRRTEYVAEVESIWERYGTGATAWLMQQELDDLKILKSDNVEVDQEVIGALIYAKEQQVYDQALAITQKRQLNKEADRRANMTKQIIDGVAVLGSFISAGSTTGGVANAVSHYLSDKPDGHKLDDDDYKVIADALFVEATDDAPEPTIGDDLESLALANRAKYWKNFKSAGSWAMNALSTELSRFEDTILSPAYNVSQANDIAQRDWALPSEQRAQKAKQDAIAEVRNQQIPEETQAAIAQRIGYEQGRAQFGSEELEQAMPGITQDWLDLAGGDHALAASLFGSMYADNMSPEDQVDIIDEMNRGFIEQLEEDDYRPTSAVLNLLAMYDHLGPSTLATGFVLFASDEDVRGLISHREFGKFYDEIKASDRKPSAAMGLEGTALGLAMDIGGSFAFDPTNIFMAPAGLRAFGRATSAADAALMASKGVGKRLAKDITRAIAKGDTAAVAALGREVAVVNPDLFSELMLWVRKGERSIGDTLAPGLKEAQTPGLQRILDTPVDDLANNLQGGVRGELNTEMANLSAAAKTELAVPMPNTKIHGVRVTVTDQKGTTWTPYVLHEVENVPGAKAVVWKDAEGNAGGFMRWQKTEDGTMSGAVLKEAPIDNFMEKTIDAVRDGVGLGTEEAANALIYLSNDASITVGGAKGIKKATQHLIDSAGGRVQAVLDAVNTEEITDILRRAIEAGADFGANHAGQTAAARAHQFAQDLLESNNPEKIHNVITRNLHPWNNTSVMPGMGPQAYKQALYNIDFMWGTNRTKAGQWSERIMDALKNGVDDLEKRLSDPRVREVDTLSQRIARLERDILDGHGIEMPETIAAKQKIKGELEEKLLDAKAGLERDFPAANQNQVGEVMKEMWDDYNREVIAKMPGWKPYVDEATGMVPWERLKIGGVTPDARAIPSIEPFADMNQSKQFAKAVEELVGPQPTFNVPISPLDMVVASSVSGSTYVKAMEKQMAARWTREFLRASHSFWVMDKVARVATGAVVSWDELYRVFHRYGYEAAMDYMSDMGTSLQARASALVRKGNISKQQGLEYLSDAQRQRRMALQDIPDEITHAENLTWQQRGQSTAVIEPSDRGYVAAAREFYRTYTGSPAFQAALDGEDSFRKWWFSDSGASFRKQTVQTEEGPRLVDWKEAYFGQVEVMDILMRDVPKGKQAMVRKAIENAARDAANGGSGYMDNAAFNYTAAVTGSKKPGFSTNPIQAGSEFLMDKFFMDPTNYRRGLLYNLSTKKESERLRKLYESTGKKIMSDEELVAALNLPKGTSLSQLPSELVEGLASRMGVMTERQIKHLAHNRAMEELSDTFYAWDQGTRVGRTSRGVFPFGGPWADMWGFWGRELLSNGVVRGNAAESKFWGALQAGVDLSPVNPKTAGSISRWANTDFNMDRGFAGGEEFDVDLSPLFFFPTQGEHAFQTLLPGLGMIPSGLLDWALEKMLATNDPVKEPEKYQEMIDRISKIIPSVQYTTGDTRSDLLGGGNISTIYRTVAGINAWMDKGWSSAGWMGDFSADIDYNREVSAILADELESLLAVTDVEDLELDITAILVDAKKKAGAEQAGEAALRWTLPARVDFDDASEQLQEVWVEWGKTLQVDFGLDTLDMNSPDNIRTVANDIREHFYSLDPAGRDLAILSQPSLAVNLVSNWTWSSKAKEELGREALLPYQSGGSQAALARHQTLIERGYLEPMTPTAKAYSILGTLARAKKNVGTSIYENLVGTFNDYKYEQISPVSKARLTLMLDLFGDSYGMQPGEERRLWERWGTYEDDFERQLAIDVGIDQDSPEFDDLKKKIKLEPGDEAMSSDFRLDGTNDTFGALPLAFFDPTPETMEMMKALGIEYDGDLTGKQVHQEIINNFTFSPAFDAEVLSPFTKMTQEKGATISAVEAGMNHMAYNDQYDDAFRENVRSFRHLVANTKENMRNRGYKLFSDMKAVRDQYAEIMYLSEEQSAMKKWWEDGYQDDFGPLDWEPPTPPVLFQDNGRLVSTAYKPKIRKFVDGDTIYVDNEMNTLLPNTVLGRPVDPMIPDGYKAVRLLGVRSRDFGTDDEGAREDRRALQKAVLDAIENGDSIYLVRDPDQFGSNTDMYGRELAWLYIGDEPYYSPDAFLPTDNR